jgi:hypothetical protein
MLIVGTVIHSSLNPDGWYFSRATPSLVYTTIDIMSQGALSLHLRG